MPRPVLIVALAIALAVAGASQAVAGPTVAAVTANPAQQRPVLVAFRGSFSLRGYRSRGYGYGLGGYTRSRPRSSLLHRVVKTAIWLYILHLFYSRRPEHPAVDRDHRARALAGATPPTLRVRTPILLALRAPSAPRGGLPRLAAITGSVAAALRGIKAPPHTEQFACPGSFVQHRHDGAARHGPA